MIWDLPKLEVEDIVNTVKTSCQLRNIKMSRSIGISDLILDLLRHHLESLIKNYSLLAYIWLLNVSYGFLIRRFLCERKWTC